jgi:hypothetical protein
LNGKEYSSSKSEKSRKRNSDGKKGSRKDPKSGKKGKIPTPKTAKQYRMELEREIRQAEAEDLSIKQEGNEVQHCATFVSHYISGKRLFIKGTAENDRIPERFMPIQQAHEIDDVLLYRYAEENDLLFHPEIREVFSLGDYIRNSLDKPETSSSAQSYSMSEAENLRSTSLQFSAPRQNSEYSTKGIQQEIERPKRPKYSTKEIHGSKGSANLANSPTKKSGAHTPRDEAISPRSETELPSEGNPPPSIAKRSQRKEKSDHLIEHMGIDPLGGAKKKRTDHLIEHMGIDPLGGAKKEEGEQKRGRGTSRKS